MCICTYVHWVHYPRKTVPFPSPPTTTQVLCASDLVKALREWSANCTSSPNIQFRHKLLSVVGDLQVRQKCVCVRAYVCV